MFDFGLGELKGKEKHTFVFTEVQIMESVQIVVQRHINHEMRGSDQRRQKPLKKPVDSFPSGNLIQRIQNIFIVFDIVKLLTLKPSLGHPDRIGDHLRHRTGKQRCREIQKILFVRICYLIPLKKNKNLMN